MSRDWPLAASALAFVVLSAALALPAILAYTPPPGSASPG